AEKSRASLLFDIVATRRVEESELVDVDPGLDTLKNVNRPADYLQALLQCGFDAPADVLAKLAPGGQAADS
ncbi:MAG TPA: hypothetical protein VHV08_04280, partial [Pirellulales bacterium]|nr:hypothetical protein [Pirellulales bacterium]